MEMNLFLIHEQIVMQSKQLFRCEQDEQNKRNNEKTRDNKRKHEINPKNKMVQRNLEELNGEKSERGAAKCIFFCEVNQLKSRQKIRIMGSNETPQDEIGGDKSLWTN